MLSLIKLENRIVLDGAAVLAAIDHHLNQHDAEASVELNTSDYLHEHNDIAGAAALLADPVTPEAADVVLIDTTLPDYQTLVSAVSPDAHVILYNGTDETAADVIAKVTALSQELNCQIDTVSILSHGGDGNFQLGNETITADAVNQNADIWASLNAVMDDNASIFIYGCGVSGGSESGQILLNTLSHAAGAKVYASDDTTGHGGDWILEASSEGASANIAPPLKFEVLQTYSHELVSAPFFLPGISKVISDEDADSGSFTFEVKDADTPYANLTGSVVSKNPEILSNVSIEKFADLGGGTSVWRVKFVPKPDQNKDATVTVTISDGTASAAKDFTISFDPKNDAPILHQHDEHMKMKPITEDMAGPGDANGTSIKNIIDSSKANNGNAITDVDEGAVEGIGIIATNSTNGRWEYSTNGGTTWNPIGTVSLNNALLLGVTDVVRFVPNKDWSGTVKDGLTIVAWDQTDKKPIGTKQNAEKPPGTPNPPRDETAYSTATELVSITVLPGNDSPILNPEKVHDLSDIKEDPDLDAGPFSVPEPNPNPGTKVYELVKDAITDPDGNTFPALGIAVVATDTTNGVWQFNIGNGWVTIGSVSQTSATLLDSNALIRFVPKDNYYGTVIDGIQFKAWDKSDNLPTGSIGINTIPSGGTSPFSTEIGKSDITVKPLNDAPIINNSELFKLNDIDEDAYDNPGTMVADMIASLPGDRITDIDANAAEGITVVGVDNAGGKWQYDIGAGWKDLNVSEKSGVVLAMNARIRFVPNKDWNGTSEISFRAWDQTDGKPNGTAGVDPTQRTGVPEPPRDTTAHSVLIGKARITVKSVNDEPIAVNDSYVVTVNTGLVIQPPGVLINDIDVDGNPLTAVQVTNPTYGTVSLNPDGSFIYTPNYNYVGEDSFTYQAVDGTSTSAPATVKITVVGSPYADVHPHVYPPSGYSPEGPSIIPLVRPYAQEPGGDLAKEKFLPGQIGETPGPGVRAFRADMWGGREIPPRDFCSLEEALKEHLGCRFASTKNPESKFDAVTWNELGWEKPYLDEEYDLYSALFLRQKGDRGFSVETGELTRSFGMDEEQAFAKENRNEEYDVYSDLFLELAPNASFNKIKPGEMKKDFFRGREHLDVTGRGLL